MLKKKKQEPQEPIEDINAQIQAADQEIQKALEKRNRLAGADPQAPVPQMQPQQPIQRERYEVVKELPTRVEEIREEMDQDGTLIKYITVEEYLTTLINQSNG